MLITISRECSRVNPFYLVLPGTPVVYTLKEPVSQGEGFVQNISLYVEDYEYKEKKIRINVIEYAIGLGRSLIVKQSEEGSVTHLLLKTEFGGIREGDTFKTELIHTFVFGNTALFSDYLQPEIDTAQKMLFKELMLLINAAELNRVFSTIEDADVILDLQERVTQLNSYIEENESNFFINIGEIVDSGLFKELYILPAQELIKLGYLDETI